jgi:N-acetyl-alpha-D-glucosaminyl L-malate synthase BshA
MSMMMIKTRFDADGAGDSGAPAARTDGAGRPLTIAMVCYPSLGGSGVIAAELARGLAERGHTVHLIATARPWRAAMSPRLHFHRVDVPLHPVFEHAPYSVAVASAIVDLARRHPVDLVQVHYAVPHAASAFMARQVLAAEGRAPRVVTSLHGSDVITVGADPSVRSVTSFAIAASDGVTAPSGFLCREARARLELRADQAIEVVPNFVDTDRFAPPEGRVGPRGEGDEIVLLHVSNFRPVKRVGDLLEVLARVRAAAPARLVLVGDGPERLALEERAKAAGLTEHVEFLGRRDDFLAELHRAHAFLLPSECESFGVAALEAQSAGVPVFAYRVGGLPEVVAGGAARLIEPFDAGAMAAAVIKAVTGPDRGAALGRAARAHVLDRYRREPALERCEAYFRRILASAAEIAP